jgi:hypothetical protein
MSFKSTGILGVADNKASSNAASFSFITKA